MELKKFRGQFNDKDWATLIANAEFKLAWDVCDVVRAGELIGNILRGTRQEWVRNKHRKARQHMRDVELQEKFREAERKMKILKDSK